MKNILVTAHAGCMNSPMDSVLSAEIGIKNKADIVEVDVRFSENGLPVLSHDVLSPNISYELLEDVFSLVSKTERIKINIDLKECNETGIRRIIELAECYNLKDRIFFTGTSRKKIEVIRSIANGIKYLLDCEGLDFQSTNFLEKLIFETKDLGAIGINPEYIAVDKNFVDAFHENDLLVYVWTVEKESHIVNCANIGVDSITSKNVKLIKDILSRDNSFIN